MSRTQMNTINTKVVVDPSGVKPGTDKALGDIRHFAHSAESTLRSSFAPILEPLGLGGLESALSGALSGIMKFATSPAGIFTGLTAGFLGASEAAHEYAVSQSKAIIELEKSADRVGMTRRQRAGFDVLFGAEHGKEVVEAFSRMNILLGQAAQGSTEAQNKLSRFGITVKEAFGRDQIANIEAFSKAIANATSPAIRGSMARDLLGKAGNQFLPDIFKIAGGGLQSAIEFADETGYSGTDEQLKYARHVIGDLRKRQIKRTGSMRRLLGIDSYWDLLTKPAESTADLLADVLNDITKPNDFSIHPLENITTKDRRSDALKRFKRDVSELSKQKSSVDSLKQDNTRDFLDSLDSEISKLSRLGEVYGMTADQISIYTLKQKADKEVGEDRARAMEKIASIQALQAANAQRAALTPFSKLSTFEALEKSLGLGPNPPSLIAGAEAGSTSAIRAQLLAQTAQASQGSMESRWAAAMVAVRDELKEQTEYDRKWKEFYEKNSVIIRPANLDSN